MFTHTTDIKWTAASLRKVLENYVVRNRIKPNSLQAIGDVENDETFCSNDAKYRLQTIIMDKSNGDLDIYGGSKELMKDLQTLQYFPNNSDFLGITDPKCEDCYSFSTTINFFHDKSGREHVSKNDLSMMVVNVLGSFYNHKTRDKLFYALLIPSLGKQMRKQLVGSYELISIDLFNRVQAEVFTIMTAQQKPSTNKDFKPIKHTVDEIFSIFARFFEGENDKNVMDLLKTTIVNCNRNTKISEDLKFYESIFTQYSLLSDTVSKISKSFPIAFHKFNDDVQRDNVIRVFKDNGTSFCFAKDVEIEFRIQDLNVETEEERKNGILRTIDFSKLQDMLKESKIKLDEKMIIEQDIIRTSRNISVPIITFYGTHCKLASDAFFEVFNHVLHGLRLFQGVNKSNIPKIYNWFSQLYDVFDSESKRYFIETWKIEEIVERAYKDLEKFVTEKIYECPREPKLYMTDISEEEVIKEVEKLSKNFELNSKFIKSRYYFYRRSVNLEVPRKYIYKIFEDCVVLRFLNENPKYHRFIHNQGLCANIELFECDCQKSLKEGELEKRSKVEILKCAHLETVYFDCNRRNKKCLVAIRNKKFYDNTTAYELAMEKCVEFENTYDLRLTELLFESLKQKLGGDFREKRGIFYVREDELKELCDETRKSFTEGCRVAYQNIDNKNTRIVTWNEVYNRLKVFFLVDGFIKPSFKKLKDQLKKHENAKDLGLPEKDVCRIQALYRQIFQNHQRLFKVTQNLTNFSIYERKDRGNILRIMCERRVDYTEWHLLDEEVLDAIKFVLKSEKRYHLYRDKIEQWEIDLYRGKHQNCVGVKLFDTILNVLQIDKRKFLLVPDIQVIQHLILMPLQMAYHSIQIDTPMGDTSLHYIQAQYYVFQRIVCDINWMHLEEEDVIEYRKKILETMKRYKRGYYSESSVCSDVRNLTENKIYEMAKKNNDRTSIAYCQRKKFDALLSKDEFSEILFKAFGNTPEVVTGCQNFLKSLGFDTQSVVFEIENWKAKYIFMRHWMNVFFGDDEQEIHSNILKAFTATMPNIKIQRLEGFKNWAKSGSMFPDDGFIDFSPVDTVYKLYRKSEEKNRDFDKNDLLEMHEWDKKARKSNDFEEYALFSDKEEEDSESKDSGDNVDQPENESCPQVVMNDDLKVIKENNKKIENCNRCYDFREEFEQVKKKVEELYKKTQMKDKDVKDLEKNLERLNRDKEYELKNLRKNFLEQNRKLEKENEQLKKDLETKEKRIQQLHQQFKTNLEQLNKDKEYEMNNLRKNFLERNQKLEKENEQLKNDLETKEKRIQQLYQQFKTEEATTSTWKFENEQKTKVLKEQLKHVSEDANRKENENIELKMRNNELEQNVKSLSEKLNENQKYIGFLESNMSYGIPPGLSLQQNHKPISNEDKMKEYEKIMKIDFGSSLDSMTRIVNKFKEIKSKGNSEIEIFKEKCLDYVKMVSDEYKNNNLTAEIPDIPQPFSLEFMQNYERLLKKGPSPVKWEKIEKKEKEKELEDNECLICFYDMEFHHRSTKCENCSRKFHKDCVSEWLKLNSICPVCRVSLPDPNEYPTL